MEATTVQTDLQTPLFEHKTREDWGLAILAWERGPRRAYQFEDGELRIFKRGYYGFMEEVDTPADRAARVVAELERKLGNSVAARNQAPVGKVAEADRSFDEQVRIFDAQYPDGFGGDSWRRDKRGSEQGRRLKRHRDAAIAAARAELSRERIDERIEAGAHEALRDACTELLGATDLVTKKQLAPLAALAPARLDAFARALRALLWSDDDAYELRLERFIGALTLGNPRGATWQLVTALPALVHPEQHVCVRPSTMRRQAAWMAPRLTLPKAPNAPSYARLCEMATAIRDDLAERRHTVRDLWDVYDFMCDTLKPSAKKLLEQ